MAQLQKAVTLLGAGTQGTRLAYMWSRCGRPVYLIDRNEKQLERSWKEIQKLRSRESVSYGVTEKSGSVVRGSADELKNAVLNSWLAIECVPESLDLKRSVIQELDSLAEAQTIVASNSSSYTITEILAGLQTRTADRFIGRRRLQVMTPDFGQDVYVGGGRAHTDIAVEIMGSGETRPAIISLLKTETRIHGFEPFHVRKSSTGYIYNRIWAAIKRETLLALSEGVATPEEIDGCFKAVLKTPKGPCELMDTVGLDVVLDIEQHYAEIRPGLPEEPRQFLETMIDQGKLGVKTGSGFFEYKSKSG
ncbi:uncharacterized protein N7459_005288 [Penicillium hispanicum]|uniref:uncharacterized protein n=1 Tax=Penicillium hispanicum TaxID=1080232 RepID=UPI002540CDDD|nr:uncharacterized protein N7459_005288 [Penicillium hispanicum]KAJ5585488.1 hypothetical protein N7459_005288 [Penicillium hispanicum]